MMSRSAFTLSRNLLQRSSRVVSANVARHASGAAVAPFVAEASQVSIVDTTAAIITGTNYTSSGGAGAGGNNTAARVTAATFGFLAIICSGLCTNSKGSGGVAQAEAEEIGKGNADPLADTKLYPQPPLLETRTIKVSKLHTVSYSLYGNPQGKPALFVHGGPGGGTVPAMARYFNPDKYFIILVDQRGV